MKPYTVGDIITLPSFDKAYAIYEKYAPNECGVSSGFPTIRHIYKDIWNAMSNGTRKVKIISWRDDAIIIIKELPHEIGAWYINDCILQHLAPLPSKELVEKFNTIFNLKLKNYD